MDKEFIDSQFTYTIVSFFDELEIYETITDVPSHLTILQEFRDVTDMTEYISTLKAINKDKMGIFLYMAIIQPIAQSNKFTNKYNFNLN